MTVLKKGDQVESSFGTLRVESCIGEGGQGEVYIVRGEDSTYALKWFFERTATERQYLAIERLVEHGMPSDQFIWPLSIVETSSETQFGYIMPLIDSQKYQKLTKFFSGDIKCTNPEIIFRACMNLVQSFYTLHLSGMCYQDISFGNIFMNFKTGDIRICDNDNVTYDHMSSIDEQWGTYGFMAPEVISGVAPPSTQTDLYALSVVLFRMLYRQHPLQGKREYDIPILDEAAFQELYATNPIYIFDPVDLTNRPVKGVQDIAEYYRAYYPDRLNAAFERAFTVGLHDPEQRLRESEWMQLLSALSAQMMYCEHCGKKLFYDAATFKHNECMGECPHCHRKLKQVPLRMRIDDRIVILNYNTQLFENQINPLDMTAYKRPLAKVIQHPKHPSVWGLQNFSERFWTYTTQEGVQKNIERTGVIPLKNGMIINFGEKMGIVRFGFQK